jgi:hypothetical protein
MSIIQSPVTLQIAEIEAQLEEEEIRAHQEAVMLARNYFNGIQEVYLNARALEYLGLHKENPFRLNICRTIVTALADELNLLGFATDEKIDKEGGESPRPVSEWAAAVFEENKLDSLQDNIQEGALADSESFVIVEWDPELNRSRIIHNPYFVDTNITGGDGLGVYMIYENDDPEQAPIAAVKRWIEQTKRGPFGKSFSRLRMTVYYPDHFERYVLENNSTWQPFNEGTGQIDAETGEEIIKSWYIPNVDSDGTPLGIPVFHFKNKGLRPEHWDGIPMQDAVNKTLVDVLAAGDLTAFQSYFGFGFYPTTDGKAPTSDGANLMKIGPAQFNGTMKKADEASLQIIQGQDSTFLMNQLKDSILLTAQITDTPASRFVVTAAIASDKTIKEQERGLKKKGAKRRAIFSDPWVGVINMARKLANVYGGAGLSEEVTLSPIWEHTETLDELSEKREKLELPIEQIWREAGYSDSQIKTMKEDPSFRVEFERKIWEGYNAASLNGIPLDLYLERIGVPAPEAAAIVKRVNTRSNVPSEDL